MKGEDNIKELFSNRFSDFEVDVDSQVWDNIQSELTNGGGSHTSTGAEKTLLGKSAIWIAAVSVSALLGVGYMVLDSEEITVPLSNTEVVDQEDTPISEVSKDKDEKVPITNNSENNTNSVSEEIIDASIASTIEELATTEKSNSNGEGKNIKVETKEPIQNNSIQVEEDKVVSKSPTVLPESIIEVEAATPNKIEMASQSSVLAMPMGGIAPLDVTFSTLAKNPVTIKWDFDDGNKSEVLMPDHTFENPGIYFVTMIAELDNGEIVMDKAIVEVKAKKANAPKVAVQSKIKVPNIFTPNGDGEHDKLVIVCKGMQSFSMSVYSVNGKLVFQTSNPEEFWDGTDKYGNQVVEGTYYYLVNAIGEDQNIYAPKGYITIRR